MVLKYALHFSISSDLFHHGYFFHQQATNSEKQTIKISLLVDPVYLFFCLAYTIGCPCIYGQWAFVPSLAIQSGLTKEDAASFVVIYSATALIGQYHSVVVKID